VIGSSSTVLANLAYLIGAVVVAFIGGLIVWIRHRQPKSVDANMASFRRGLNALAPDTRSAAPAHAKRPDQFKIRPVAAGLTHVRLGSDGGGPAAADVRGMDDDDDDADSVALDGAPAAQIGEDVKGGQPG
jgi:hypothetical protein